ncbi:flagellin lysine-N-methylase [Rickettsiales endosymbiont of Stachyamoeba lipophora]|uniref:flagellin lysine-N-methylase n=1 Tax=Rickettsiales endosymbiont of Stachyamoeba lipophora TaxID=2486578 RepID=UPI000F64C374|nr:flagellin lysine-N-methylase [Rickettsiales endosymbiont of Stachyamoeba lipophora]AZL16194.1 hypothetical protein EF513_06590 [Rickettsiales endosymbiont of Stachyamoeba lipophora]
MSKHLKDFTVSEYNFVSQFKCLSDKCPNTCCKKWDMQLDINTKVLYDTVYSNLKSIVTISNGNFILKRDSNSDACIKFQNGLCGVHKEYGSEALGDVCYFYPRLIYKIEDSYLVSASLSCPEITRLAFFGDNPLEIKFKKYERVPMALKNYFDGVNNYQYCIKIHKFFLNLLAKENTTNALLKCLHIANEIAHIPKKEWYDTMLAINQIGSQHVNEDNYDKYDPARLIQCAVMLIKSTQKTPDKEIYRYFSNVEQLGKFIINWHSTNIDCLYSEEIDLSQELSKQSLNFINLILKKWVRLQLINNFYPFSGVGDNLYDKTVHLIVKYLILKIMLYANLNNIEDEEKLKQTTIEIIYMFSRIFDHMADLKFFKNIIEDYGWNNHHKFIGMLKKI